MNLIKFILSRVLFNLFLHFKKLLLQFLNLFLFLLQCEVYREAAKLICSCYEEAKQKLAAAAAEKPQADPQLQPPVQVNEPTSSSDLPSVAADVCMAFEKIKKDLTRKSPKKDEDQA